VRQGDKVRIESAAMPVFNGRKGVVHSVERRFTYVQLDGSAGTVPCLHDEVKPA